MIDCDCKQWSFLRFHDVQYLLFELYYVDEKE